MNPNPNKETQNKLFEFLQFMKKQEILMRKEIPLFIANKETDEVLIGKYNETLAALNKLGLAMDLTLEFENYLKEIEKIE